MNKLYNLLNSHEVARMPSEIKQRKNLIITISILSTLFFDILSLSVKVAQTALGANLKIFALVIIILFFIREVLGNSIRTFTDTQRNQFARQRDDYITKNISNISNAVRGKVFRKDDNYSLIMTNSEVIFHLKEYIGYIWGFWESLPFAISDSITAIVLSFTILLSEFLQTGNLKLTLSFSVILVICIILFIILFKLRLTVRQTYRENNRKLRKENDILFNDIKNIEPLIKNEFTYRVFLLIDKMKNKRDIEKEENFKLNFLLILRSLVLAIFMILIIIMKLHYEGGIENFSILVLTDILATSTVYSNIINKVASILGNLENIANTIKDVERVKPDVDNIMDVYSKENSIEFASDEFVYKIQVEIFEFSYPGAKSVYKLRNTIPFELERGKAYLVYGHTGCGKSTFMHLLIGKIRMDISPISYGNTCLKAYLASIMHESHGKLGANPVLQELIFSSDISQLNQVRMIEILHGTHIYEDIMCNLGLISPDDNKILEYLNSTTIEQYSSGQKQRLAIVKVLYNLSKQHQIVVFDEATNALDDETAISVLKFMSNYCQKDMKRIVLFVSHQVNLTQEIADGKITFVSNTFPVFDIVPEL